MKHYSVHLEDIDAMIYFDRPGEYVYQDACGWKTYRTKKGLVRALRKQRRVRGMI